MRRAGASPAFRGRFFHESAWERQGEQDTAGNHQGLVKIPRIFLALPNPASLAPTRGLLPLIAKKSGCIEADGDGGGYDAADQMVMAS